MSITGAENPEKQIATHNQKSIKTSGTRTGRSESLPQVVV